MSGLRKQRSAFTAAIALTGFMLLNGCATYRTVSSADDRTPLLMSGSRLDIHAMSGNEAYVERTQARPPRYPALDLIPSLIGDVVLLPAMVPVALYQALFE